MNKAVRDMIPGLVCGAGILILALGASFARRHGYIDQETTLRLVIGANGLMMAYFGNSIPKVVAPTACARKITRFTGWSLVLSGIAYTALWVFAPIQQAVIFGTAVVAAGILATLGYCLHLRKRTRPEPR